MVREHPPDWAHDKPGCTCDADTKMRCEAHDRCTCGAWGVWFNWPRHGPWCDACATVEVAMTRTRQARERDEWGEEDGPVLWWRFPVTEPPYCGTPLDDDFPEYVTHWTTFEVPEGSLPSVRLSGR